MTTYYAIAGQSIYDVCLQTYGTLDYIYKLMRENNIEGLDSPVFSRQAFTWDETEVEDQVLNAGFENAGVRFATDVSGLGAVYYVFNDGGGVVEGGGGDDGGIYNPPANQPTYQMILATEYTSNADGTTVINPLDINGAAINGYDIVQLELEIKPLRADQYVWNKGTGVITLLDGLTVDNGATLFILYSKIVNA